MKAIIVIPVRWGSTRFPGKPLVPLGGWPMVRHVYERAASAPQAARIIVATDDERILAAVRGFGGEALLTSPALRSGTDRVAAVAAALGLAPEELVVNIQGDQPLFEPLQIEEVTRPLLSEPSLGMATLIYRIRRPEEITHPNAVKTVFDCRGYALYFSRATIPYDRDTSAGPCYKHHGIYAYRASFLARFAIWPTGHWEEREALEQLRALEQGERIRVVESAFDSLEIDSPEDLERAREIIAGS